MSEDEKKLMETFENYQKFLYGESFKYVKGTEETLIPTLIAKERFIPVYYNGKLIGYSHCITSD